MTDADASSMLNALGIVLRENEAMRTNLTATQARCTELLDEARAMGRTIRAQDAAIQSLENALSVTQEARTPEVQAQTIRRLRAIGYRVVKRCGAYVSLAFERP
jgi:hypothetical protein